MFLTQTGVANVFSSVAMGADPILAACHTDNSEISQML
jgi:hypothetical protein